MINRKKLNIITILLLTLSLILSGCTKTTADTKDSSVPSSTLTTGISDADKNNSAFPISDPASDETESIKGDDTSESYDSVPKEYSPDISESKIADETPRPKMFASKTESSSEGEPLYDVAGEEGVDGYYEYPESATKEDEVRIIDESPYPERNITVKAGLLTGGEWNDNKNFDFLKKLIKDGQDYTYNKFFTDWELNPFNRLVILCQSATGSALQMVKITVTDKSGNPIWKGVTDHEGMAYAYYALLDSDMMPSKVIAEYDDLYTEYTVQNEDLLDSSIITINIGGTPKPKKLDLMFTVDTTGSMGDEIEYLQTELEDVIKRVKEDSSDIPIRLSVNFYKDVDDEYVLRPYEFSDDIDEQLAYLNKEYAYGGGDFEEAVEQALDNSINEHSWNDDSIKLMFLVLDAPPHNRSDIRESLKNTLSKASEKGIRIIPIASSGIDKATEFVLRAFAMTTGGTYTFLTDHSGIGGSHIEPTTGEYKVEQLNDMLVRIIETYIGK